MLWGACCLFCFATFATFSSLSLIFEEMFDCLTNSLLLWLGNPKSLSLRDLVDNSIALQPRLALLGNDTRNFFCRSKKIDSVTRVQNTDLAIMYYADCLNAQEVVDD